MSQLIRLVYASRSNSASRSPHQGLDPGVARILAKSKRNNARRHIVGSLLFGDGCFLQCLEGADRDVDALYDKIRADPRHRDVTVLSRTEIAQCSFGAWSMKYAPGEEPLRRLMQTLKATRFDPYGLSSADLAAVVDYMERATDVSAASLGDGTAEPAPEERLRSASYIDTLEPRQSPAAPSSAALLRASGHGKVLRLLGVLAAAVLVAGCYFYLNA